MSTDGVKSFLAGWAGGISMIFVGHPFDTVKIAVQHAKPGEYRNSFDCARRIVRREGPLALYKGCLAPMITTGMCVAVVFCAHDAAERAIRRYQGVTKDQALALPQVMACGAFAGFCGALVLGPTELIKIRQQTAQQAGKDSSFVTALRRGALSRGLSAMMLVEVPGGTAWFAGNEVAKSLQQRYLRRPERRHSPSRATLAREELIAGGIAGLCFWGLVMPADIVKTRMQSAKKPVSLRTTVREVHGEGGAGGFYRGLGPALARAFKTSAACFFVKDRTHRALDRLF
uniref:Mitochondrial carrier protein n=1 Tax=Neobodo designis TaxID=312471 RepID=A0A7S1QZB2_NEODS|mmetsp:Transcript_54829/g.169009  ORF Transcript_54829/g.169009 Transcript_54829/m.169009 type:complete len:287 (+) Transcript_54829:146-1006(+)|eukprot:CAMPEP_0174879374 /NCGR_PEP_ID=MMETSP1114-20130205/83230_1 /TAXON_ID=312471 /ORGANISM="Neobodo designis, Strain CCAP 1951/1" /LENGTH=286 /DNA_ID=CAMNT_0016114767 /DNA_START=124 /DNA_END=984 /DNA_ORIENTATION=+